MNRNRNFIQLYNAWHELGEKIKSMSCIFQNNTVVTKEQISQWDITVQNLTDELENLTDESMQNLQGGN